MGHARLRQLRMPEYSCDRAGSFFGNGFRASLLREAQVEADMRYEKEKQKRQQAKQRGEAREEHAAEKDEELAR